MMKALLNFPLNWFYFFFLIKGQKSVKGCWNGELPRSNMIAQATLCALLL